MAQISETSTWLDSLTYQEKTKWARNRKKSLTTAEKRARNRLYKRKSRLKIEAKVAKIKGRPALNRTEAEKRLMRRESMRMWRHNKLQGTPQI